MNFLEAHRVLASSKGGAPLAVRLMASGNVDPLTLYVRAELALRGRAATIETLDFGTLGQALISAPAAGRTEVILLMPWDLVPECDWRSGVPRDVPLVEALLERGRATADRLASRGARLLYIPAPLPPLYDNPGETARLGDGAHALALAAGARSLPADAFALGNYLASGVPVAGSRATDVVRAIADHCAGGVDGTAKVLVTDLDNVMWAGLAGEDGVDGVKCAAEGVGFRHFLYQTLLARLKRGGALLAAVSRNDLALARAPIAAGRTQLTEQDFVEILASFESKSGHIRRLAERLNLGLDSFVFVDDNPVEIAEVGTALPAVRCVQFPAHDDELPAFFDRLAALFARTTVTDEDRRRTELYRQRMASAADPGMHAEGADLHGFLSGLGMELTITDRSSGPRERAVQLINKTNQFNLNGRRVTDEAVGAMLATGGALYTATLEDRTGSHGEILSCLVDPAGRVESLVLSCRVFQRRVEHAFLVWLLRRSTGPVVLDFATTDRNTPLREFLADPAFSAGASGVAVDAARFIADHESDLSLFTLKEVVGAGA